MLPEVNRRHADDVRMFLQRLGLSVQDLTLVERALTHSSYAFENQLEHDNERLEFLGDAVLGLAVSEYLYQEYPRSPEGVLSKYKAQIVSRNVLGQRALDLGLGNVMLLGRGEEAHGGRERPALLGSALEALVGALYLELGLGEIVAFLRNQVFEPAITLSGTQEYGDYKSKLQELVQKEFQSIPEYELVDESGPDHHKHFEVAVHINGAVAGRGEGSRKKIAENRAAMQAYWNLCEELGKPLT
jgi:ribonuclease III